MVYMVFLFPVLAHELLRLIAVNRSCTDKSHFKYSIVLCVHCYQPCVLTKWRALKSQY